MKLVDVLLKHGTPLLFAPTPTTVTTAKTRHLLCRAPPLSALVPPQLPQATNLAPACTCTAERGLASHEYNTAASLQPYELLNPTLIISLNF